MPTDTYDLDAAVKDGFLVPPQAISVPLKFQRQGIRYDAYPTRRRRPGTHWSGTRTAPSPIE